jgi:peptidoglycan hydrolase CwlO-like protein
MSSTEEQLAEVFEDIKASKADIAKYKQEIESFENRIRGNEDERELRNDIRSKEALIKSTTDRLTGLEAERRNLIANASTLPQQSK